MKVYFQNGNRKERLIGEADDRKQAMKIIRNFCDERGFYIPYTRSWADGNRIYVDVGSWSEKFIIEE